MKRRFIRTATTAAATALATASLAVMPSTASAASNSDCSAEQHKAFDTLGVNLDVYVTLCVYRDSSNNYKAKAIVRWHDGNQGANGGMEKLYVQVRLEHNDADYKTEVANYSNLTNSQESGTYHNQTGTYNSGSTGGWTADGHVVWNVDLDGDGDHTWSLHGSGSI